MDAFSGAAMMLGEDCGTAGVLRQLFGNNRAEWLPERFGDLFIAPAYFAKLVTKRPSIIVGGRGTGKTTALRSLRFDLTLDRLESAGMTFGDQEYLGVYIRINKNRVTAFQGNELAKEEWRKAFAHYFNLLGAIEFCCLASWLEKQTDRLLSPPALAAIAGDLAVPPPSSTHELRASISRHISELQLFINNPQSAPRPTMSMADTPLRTFAVLLQNEELIQERTIFCCIDEYENLLDDQQAILNTYIKHAESPLSYKIGVRRNGLRTRHTIDGADLLQEPDDYAEIDIATEGFELFATAVAELRLRRAKDHGADVPTSLASFLDPLAFDEEAHLLGADKVAIAMRQELQSLGDQDLARWALERSNTDLFFLKYWAEYEGGGPAQVARLARNWLDDDGPWRNRLNNYGYASLFWLSKGRKGARIRKYYCGEKTILSLAAGNIRYFLELLEESIAEELASRPERKGPLTISPTAQTVAARAVGKRRLDQLEGLAAHGVELKRLVLAVGKVFFELARSPMGRTPEVTFFVLSGAQGARLQVEELLQEGVSHLAFEVSPRTKATTSVEMRDSEYRLHPIFCAFFEISHRRKRRKTFKAEDLVEVSRNPARAISLLLEGSRQSDEDDLPEQLDFFSTFFSGGDDSDSL